MLHLRPALFVQNMVFDAGPPCRGLVKKGDHLFMFFGLHLKAGEHGAAAHNKGDSTGRQVGPMGFFTGIDESSSEGNSLVIESSFRRPIPGTFTDGLQRFLSLKATPWIVTMNACEQANSTTRRTEGVHHIERIHMW
jgi:hypothetical protein